MQIRIFQDREIAQARRFLQLYRQHGQCAAAFVYGAQDDALEGDYGALIVGIPASMGLTYPGHAAIKRNFAILECLHRERLAVRIRDTDIEQAISLIKPALCVLDQSD